MDDQPNRPQKKFGRRFGGWQRRERDPREEKRNEASELNKEALDLLARHGLSHEELGSDDPAEDISDTDLAPGALGVEQGSEAKESRSRFSRKSARHKAMDFLARRGYSENELRLKLLRDYPEDDVEDAITHVRENNWLSPPEEIAERVAAELGRKKKGHRFINQFLKSKGLPAVTKDLDSEVEKARELVSAKMKHDFETDGPLPWEAKMKAQRILMNRGFDLETIRKALQP
jgi:SOS response regulatory protein OraA/RecX